MKTFLFALTAVVISTTAFCQTVPELVFMNPVLVNGNANQEGAVYRFNNVTTGVDAEIKIKKFSRNDIVMATIDNSVLGFNKAFQPEFGLPGLVAANQHWYIDFEMSFFNAGTSNSKKLNTVKLTALDVDGDAHSIAEYTVYDRPNSINYCAITLLTSTATGVLGQNAVCPADGISSPLVSCTNCGGDGMNGNDECGNCQGSGKLHDQCDHAFTGCSGSIVSGPIANFIQIDTLATQVMVTYSYTNVKKIKFRYGAKSSVLQSNGSGIRLNSSWFREFSLAVSTLPVSLTSFSAILSNNNRVDLKWTTASERNVSHFIVEKSTDGTNYTDAGMAFAYGNATDITNYSLSDNINTNQAAVFYYRLRSVDIDGKSELSATRIIRVGKQNENNISIVAFPNPVKNEVRITIPSNWQNKKVVYELIHANGQSVKRMEIANSSQTETLNLSSLAPGFYIVRASCEGLTTLQRIVKQ